eukprot:scaffold26462_cov27-Attheya_sp.AAC.1
MGYLSRHGHDLSANDMIFCHYTSLGQYRGSRVGLRRGPTEITSRKRRGGYSRTRLGYHSYVPRAPTCDPTGHMVQPGLDFLD